MANENPYQPGSVDSSESPAQNVSSGQATYNVISDTVTGINVRKRDNVYQAIFILATTFILAAVGAVLAATSNGSDMPWYGGAIIGAFAGLVAGFFASGVFLMVYRAARHLKGRHD